MAINGGSAGGILVGRAMTARPDLWAVAVPEVGVLNALRAETSANGVPNIPEFGTVKDEAAVQRPAGDGRVPPRRGRREVPGRRC